MNVKVSFVMAVLNTVNYIEESILSALNQTIDEIELIIVDAGSTDGTLELAEKYKCEDQRVTLIHSDKKSAGYQNNIGINAARGEFVSILEPDDYIAPNMCELLFPKAVENDLDWIKGDYAMFVEGDSGRLFVEKRMFSPAKEELYEKILDPHSSPRILIGDSTQWRGLYRKSFLRKYRIESNETSGAAFQDIGFVQQTIIFARRIMYTADICYYYRRDNNDSSVKNQKTIKYLNDEIRFVLKKMESSVDTQIFYPAVYERAFGTFMGQLYKLPLREEWSDTLNDEVSKLLNVLNDGIKRKYLSLQECPWATWINFSVILQDYKVIGEYYIVREKAIQRGIVEFINSVKKWKQIVICGFGDEGRKLEIIMRYNNVDNIVAICDNDKRKIGKKSINGLGIKSFEEVTQKFSDAGFIVSVGDENVKYIISQQLKLLGISNSKIIDYKPMLNHFQATTRYINC